MQTMIAMALTMSLLASGVSSGAAPVVHLNKTITIAASAHKVWEASKNFNGLNTWHPALAGDELLGGTHNTVGAVRLLTLKGGDTENDKAALDAIAGVYTGGLNNLQKIVEAK